MALRERNEVQNETVGLVGIMTVSDKRPPRRKHELDTTQTNSEAKIWLRPHTK